MKVAVLHPRKGVAGLWTPAVDATTKLAAAEINAAGGILGSAVELVYADCGVEAETAIAAVDHLLDEVGVRAIVGQHTSTARDAVRMRVAERVPYVYTAQHEGLAGACSGIMIGATDGELLWPAISWLASDRRAQRFFFVGNDYIWPHVALKTSRALVAHEGAQMVGHALMPFETCDYSQVMAKIRECRPDVVIQALVGEASVTFNRAFAEAGLDRQVLRLGLLVDESVICGIGPDATHNLYSVSNYFSEWQSPENCRFLDNYHGAFGRLAPPVSSASIGCYEGLHLLAALAGRRPDPGGHKLAELARRPLAREAARKHICDGPVGRCRQVHIAQADGVSLSIVTSMTMN
ncbi:MAG: nitrile hydratase [Rhodobacteraceae bacterium]|nr:nitrile hydratase [Paracoccaceae bacterium]